VMVGTALTRLCPPYDCTTCRDVARNNLKQKWPGLLPAIFRL
jgi:hypothetical protein